MSSSPRHHSSGWLMLTLGTGLVLMVVLLLGWSPDVDRIRLVIRATARTSLAFFLLAYTASALHALWPSSWSMWIRAHRRQWGLLFVLSHTLHAGAIVSLAVAAPDLFQTLAPLGNRITGGLAYLVLWSMGATSFDRSAQWLGQWLGRSAWARLHTWGSQYIWLSFVVANGKRIALQPIYLVPTLILMLAMGLRWYAARTSAIKPGSTTSAPA